MRVVMGTEVGDMCLKGPRRPRKTSEDIVG